MCAIERSRAVARRSPRGRRRRRGRAPRSPSAGRWPSTAALIGGPNHGSLRPSATVSSSSCRRARVCAPVGQQLARRGGGQLLGARVDEPGGILRRLVERGREAGFVGDGDQRDPVGPQQVRDLVGDGPTRRGRRLGPRDRGSSATSASSSSLSARRSATIGPAPAMPVTLARRLPATADGGVRSEAEQVQPDARERPARVRARRRE